MENEIRDFCREHMPEIENDFWKRCDTEIRFLFTFAVRPARPH